MNKLKLVAASISSVFVLSGCQSTKLSEVDGSGALLVPVKLEMSGSTYACRSIGLKSGDKEHQFFINTNNYEYELNDKGIREYSGYGLISDLEPGEYKVTELSCWAREGFVFNGNKPKISHKIFEWFNISPNAVTVLNFGLQGSEVYTGQGTKFNYRWVNHGSNGQDKAKEILFKNQEIPEGWEFK